MSIFAIILLAVLLIALLVIVGLGVIFCFCVKALEEAHRDGWDMPS
jgi:hypothetical protein